MRGCGFNPLFSGLTLKGRLDRWFCRLNRRFNPLFSGLTLKGPLHSRRRLRRPRFNPLFSGLTLKVGTTLGFGGDKAVSIPYFRG